MKLSTLILAVCAFAVTGVATAAAQQNPPKVPICHATGSMTKPYVKITVPASTAAKHVGHHHDIIGTPGQQLQCPATALSTRGGGAHLTANLSGTGTTATG